jgi:hypothetical protein
VAVAQDALAKAKDHAAVPPDQHLKRGLIAAADEALDELGVGQRATVPAADNSTQLADGSAQLLAGHGHAFPEGPALEV